MVLIYEAERSDLSSLIDWEVHRWGVVERGFQGRTNKLVDGSYSWQGGALALIERLPSSVLGKKLQQHVKEVGKPNIGAPSFLLKKLMQISVSLL